MKVPKRIYPLALLPTFPHSSFDTYVQKAYHGPGAGWWWCYPGFALLQKSSQPCILLGFFLGTDTVSLVCW